jgi:hypothetical protein
MAGAAGSFGLMVRQKPQCLLGFPQGQRSYPQIFTNSFIFPLAATGTRT